MDRDDWDLRYGGDELIWTATPNQFLVAEVEHLRPRRAADLACGEGRNALWLAERGWQVTGVDYSRAGLAKAARLAEERGVGVTWVEADLCSWTPPSQGYDLVAICYLQLPAPEREAAFRIAASAVAPGGTLVVVAHDAENLLRGVGGPKDPAVLYGAEEIGEIAQGAGLVVERAEQVLRIVDELGPDRAIDLVVRASRPGS